MDRLSKFCKNPTKQNFLLLDELTQVILNASAEYYIKKGRGDLERARKIQMYYSTSTLSKNSLRGLRSIFLAMKMLKLEEFVKISDDKYPILIVYLEGFENKAFSVRYETRRLDGMFIVQQTNDLLGVDKELVMYEEEAKLYFVDVFSKNGLNVEKIDVKLSKDIAERNFYDRNIGVIWSNEECVKCMGLKDKGQKLNRECQKLIADNCYEKIRYRNQGGEKKSASPLKTRIGVVKKKECPVCDVLNETTAKKCIACETKF